MHKNDPIFLHFHNNLYALKQFNGQVVILFSHEYLTPWIGAEILSRFFIGKDCSREPDQAPEGQQGLEERARKNTTEVSMNLKQVEKNNSSTIKLAYIEYNHNWVELKILVITN